MQYCQKEHLHSAFSSEKCCQYYILTFTTPYVYLILVLPPLIILHTIIGVLFFNKPEVFITVYRFEMSCFYYFIARKTNIFASFLKKANKNKTSKYFCYSGKNLPP